MSWLKLDDVFDTHPKTLALRTDERRWTWTRILLFTCRHMSPVVPETIRDVIQKATPKFLEDCIQVGLIDVQKDGKLHVHNWHLYNGATIDDKVAAYMDKYPQATANQVHKAIGGKREAVLAVYSKRYPNGTPPVPEQYPDGTSEVPDQSTPPVPLARARGPVPSRPRGSEDQELQPPNPNPAVDVDAEGQRRVADLVHAAQPDDIPF